MKTTRCYNFRCYPRRSQKGIVRGWFRLQEALWNAALQIRVDAWERQTRDHAKVRQSGRVVREGVALSSYDFVKQVTELRAEEGLGIEWDGGLLPFSAVPRSAQTDLLRRMDRAYDAFFRRLKEGGAPGFPRFRGRKNPIRSVGLQYGQGCKIRRDRLHIAGVGQMDIVLDRPLPGTPKNIILQEEPDGRWMLSVQCTEVEVPAARPPLEEELGVDLGLSTYARLSDGSTIDNPRHLDKKLALLRTAQRQFSRKVVALAGRRRQAASKRPTLNPYKSKTQRRKIRRLARRCAVPNRMKGSRLRVAKIHGLVRRQRHDFLHKVSRLIVDQAGKIAIEQIAVAQMLPRTDKDPKIRDPRTLNRRCADASWSALVRMVAYKAEAAGRVFVAVAAEAGQKDEGTLASAQRILDKGRKVWNAPPEGGNDSSPPKGGGNTKSGASRSRHRDRGRKSTTDQSVLDAREGASEALAPAGLSRIGDEAADASAGEPKEGNASVAGTPAASGPMKRQSLHILMAASLSSPRFFSSPAVGIRPRSALTARSSWPIRSSVHTSVTRSGAASIRFCHSRMPPVL